MNLRDLEFLAAACRTGSFIEAGKVLGTVQSNVSLRIRNLERSLGVRLFERHRWGVVPTAKGRVLYRYAKRLAAVVARIEREIGARRGKRR
ncbi:MAG: LysR family transcriptional regulator [Pseudomonadota bacterium]